MGARHDGAALPAGAIASTWLSATVLIAAGLYQLAPLKRACVTRCRSPLLQLMDNWRDGANGALKLGFHQGSWCVGCCWALMVLMFVVGVMNLAWMAILSGFVLAEKLMPARWHLDVVAGVTLVAWGGWLLAGAG
ncbi:putative metal-binding membrane protein [Rhodanobacter sp. TND4EL1]